MENYLLSEIKYCEWIFANKKNRMAKIPPLEMYLPRDMLASVVHTAGPGCTVINVIQNLQTTKIYIYNILLTNPQALPKKLVF
jgi:hypothetical protein